MCPTKRMWARIVCGVLASSRGLKTQLCCVSVGASDSSSTVVGRASRKVMHEGAVRVVADGAGGRALPVTIGSACGGVVMAPAGKTDKDERQKEEG